MWFKQKNEDDGEDTLSPSKTYNRIRRRKGVISDRSRATTVLKAMSNIQRLQILSHLISNKEMSVKELEEMIQTLSQSALSQHLGRLRRANILKARRDSQMVYYSINDDNVQTIMALLNNMYGSDPIFSSKK